MEPYHRTRQQQAPGNDRHPFHSQNLILGTLNITPNKNLCWKHILRIAPIVTNLCVVQSRTSGESSVTVPVPLWINQFSNSFFGHWSYSSLRARLVSSDYRPFSPLPPFLVALESKIGLGLTSCLEIFLAAMVFWISLRLFSSNLKEVWDINTQRLS